MVKKNPLLERNIFEHFLVNTATSICKKLFLVNNDLFNVLYSVLWYLFILLSCVLVMDRGVVVNEPVHAKHFLHGTLSIFSYYQCNQKRECAHEHKLFAISLSSASFHIHIFARGNKYLPLNCYVSSKLLIHARLNLQIRSDYTNKYTGSPLKAYTHLEKNVCKIF